jgi:integrase/recombinase XerD
VNPTAALPVSNVHVASQAHDTDPAAGEGSVGQQPIESVSDAIRRVDAGHRFGGADGGHQAVGAEYFIRWCHHEAISQPTQLTRDVLERYQGHLHSVRKSDGTPLAPNTRVCRLNPLKAFTRWLVRSGVLDQDPAAELIVPRVPRRLPGRVPTVREMERILRTPHTDNAEGLRDRAILEVLYSTGMRRMEVVRLPGRQRRHRPQRQGRSRSRHPIGRSDGKVGL